MNKQEVYEFLRNNNIGFEAVEHEAVFHMGEEVDRTLPYPEADAKNLFLRDDKKQNYCLITVRGDKRVDLKAFRREHGLRPLSFGSPEALKEKLDLVPGSVSPFGLLSNDARDVVFYLDKDFLEEPYLIGCHPNDNTATVFIKTEDMIRLIEAHGTTVETVKLPVTPPPDLASASATKPPTPSIPKTATLDALSESRASSPIRSLKLSN